jgi:RHS repeat-associated protein
MFVNALFSGGNTSTANFTAYVNPYIVVSKGGHYTKHIYIGSQRIVSKLGDLDSYGADPRRIEYAGADVDGTLVDYKSKYNASQQTIKDRYAIFEVPYLGKDNDDYVNGQGFCCDDTPQGNALKATRGNDNPELFQYYYHSDHLGSTSLITNLDGEVVQHVEYVPFGEVFIEERNNRWNTPYLFNAKELDEETGLYYYGARYYEPRTSVWLSVDPLTEKKTNISGYAYCLGNPVRLIDPDGKDEYEFTAAGYIKNVKETDFDSFHKVTLDENGKSTRVEGGSLTLDKKVVTGQTVLKGRDSKEVNYLKIKGDNEAKQIFEHLANNSVEYRTEYGLTRIGETSGDTGLNLIGVNSIHTEGSTAANSVVFNNGYTIREAIHNHPSGNKKSSDGDIDVAKMIQRKFPIATFFNYTQKHGYTAYDKNTPYPVYEGNIIPEVTIQPR